MHLEMIFQLLMCGPDAATTPVVCTSGLEIEFYPNLTPEFFFGVDGGCCCLSLCMGVVEVMVVRMVPFLKQEVGIG